MNYKNPNISLDRIKKSNEKVCHRKKKFGTYERAEKVRKHQSIRYILDGKTHTLTVYKCELCKYYHIGNYNKSIGGGKNV